MATQDNLNAPLRPEQYVLDTSVFSNPGIFIQFADDFAEAIATFTRLAARAKAHFYMPWSVYEELQKLKELGATAADFERVVHIRSPRRLDLRVPSELLYEFIEEVRMRIDRGLRIAEESTKRAVIGGAADIGHSIAKLRQRYREAMRRGIIDSKEDADVLLLAYELDATLVTADEGLKKWADKAGVGLINPQHLRRIMEGLIEDETAL
ncbi:MAG: RNA ligase partner protein [Gammaproteobacteria bacterium]